MEQERIEMKQLIPGNNFSQHSSQRTHRDLSSSLAPAMSAVAS